MTVWLPQDFHKLKSFAKSLTYVGILLTTGLSIYSLRLETVIKSHDPLKPHNFTPAGRKYLVALLISAILTISSSWIESYADGKISDEASDKLQKGLQKEFQKELGSQLTQFDQALDGEQKVVKKSLGDLSLGIKSATSELQTSVDSASRAIQQNSDASRLNARRMSQSVRDLQLSSVVLSRFFMRLSIPGVNPPQETPPRRALRTDGNSKLAKIQDTACALQHRSEGPGLSLDNKCDQAFSERKSWNETFDFFNYLDPMAHLDLHVNFELSAFVVNIFSWDRPNGVHGPDFLIMRTDPSLSAREHMYSGGASTGGLLEISFGLDDQGEGNKGRTYYSRDLDLVMFKTPFQVTVCDKHRKTEDSATIKHHLSMFPADQTLKLTVIGFEKTSAEHPNVITKEYFLEPASHPGEDDCIVVDYR
jgi:hypothetical protein